MRAMLVASSLEKSKCFHSRPLFETAMETIVHRFESVKLANRWQPLQEVMTGCWAI